LWRYELTKRPKDFRACATGGISGLKIAFLQHPGPLGEGAGIIAVSTSRQQPHVGQGYYCSIPY
jgi:hypothetical protein